MTIVGATACQDQPKSLTLPIINRAYLWLRFLKRWVAGQPMLMRRNRYMPADERRIRRRARKRILRKHGWAWSDDALRELQDFVGARMELKTPW